MIDLGQLAPDFTLPRDGGGTVTLSALRGGKVSDAEREEIQRFLEDTRHD